VVETGRAEAVPQLLAQSLVLAEHQPVQDRAPFSPQAGCDRARELAVDPVGDAADPAATADLLPTPPPSDHVHSSTPEIRPLVEAVARTAGCFELDDALDPRALRRRAPQRQLEQHRLAQ
jgi:hypothetical protein